MSGGIYFTDGEYWSSAGWLFDAVLRALASAVPSTRMAALLREVISTGVGILEIASLSEDDQTVLLLAIRDDLYPAMVLELSQAEDINTAEALRHVSALVASARDRS